MPNVPSYRQKDIFGGLLVNAAKNVKYPAAPSNDQTKPPVVVLVCKSSLFNESYTLIP